MITSAHLRRRHALFPQCSSAHGYDDLHQGFTVCVKPYGRHGPHDVAPQHGHILTREKDILLITKRLMELRGIGIDGVPDA